MRKVQVSTALRPLADYVAGLRDEPLLLIQGRKAVAAIIPLRNVDRETLALSQHPEFLDLIARSRADFVAGRIISLSEMKRRVLARPSPNKRIQPTARRARRG